MKSSWLNKTPVLRLLLPYVAGLLIPVCSLKLVVALWLTGLWLLLAFRAVSGRLPSAWNIRWMPGVAFSLFWTGLGCAASVRLNDNVRFPGIEGERLVATVCLMSEPVQKRKSLACEVRIREVSGTSSTDWTGKQVMLYLKPDTVWNGLRSGDCIRLDFAPHKPPEGVSQGGFDYGAWLRRKGICATGWIRPDQWDGRLMRPRFHLRASSERIRNQLIGRFEKAGMEGPELALLSALALGKTDGLDAGTRQDFSVAGVSHVLSVSGLHVGAVYAVLAWLLGLLLPVRRGKIPKQLLLILCLVAYAYLTGLAPSVLRSTLMFSLVAAGKCLDRKSQTLNTVLVSALLLLLLCPAFLYDLGFRLSYSAVLSIVLLHKPLSGLFRTGWKPLQRCWEMVSLSFVAQLGTAPITLFVFHVFPTYFLLNNLLAVPWSGLLIYLSMAFLPLADIPWLGPLLARILKWMTSGFLGLASEVSGWPAAQSGPWFPSALEAGWSYAVMATFCLWFIGKRRRLALPFLVSLACWQFVWVGQLFFDL